MLDQVHSELHSVLQIQLQRKMLEEYEKRECRRKVETCCIDCYHSYMPC